MSGSASRRERAAKAKQERAQERLARRLEKEDIVLAFDYDPRALGYHGPVINTDLTITDAQAQALASAGQRVPDPVRCRFLIDTGADGTVVKHEFAERAGLKIINDNLPLHGVGVDTTGKAYMGRILFTTKSKFAGASHPMYVDTQVMGATLESDLIDGLIGRDVLMHFQLTYDGRTGAVRMKYYRPVK